MFRKGQSAMIATVLLIMAAVIAGVLVSSFSQKSTEKVSDKIVELGSSVDCNDVRLSLIIDPTNADTLILRNRGSLGIDQIVLRKYRGEVPMTREIDQFDGAEKLLPSEVVGTVITYEYGLDNFNDKNYDRIEAKPIIINEENDLIGCGDVSIDAS